jgi:putative hydrolase of the HAD superfamily
VIFDFFGTLSASATARERRAGHEEVAAILGVPAQAYADAVLRSWPERATGRLGDLEATMRWLAAECGRDLDDETCAAACVARRRSQRDYVRIRPEAEPVLRKLTANGLRVGVVSDCTHEVPEQWPELVIAKYVDAPVFSVEVGVKKPDPAIYLIACERLGVPPADCVYVGDGDSDELAGAEAMGMTPFRLLAPDHANATVIVPVAWDGPTIGSLTEVEDLYRPGGSRVR